MKSHCHKKVIWYVETPLRWSYQVSISLESICMNERLKYYLTDISLWKSRKEVLKWADYMVEYRSTIAVGVVLKRSCQSLWSWRPPPFNQPKKGLEQNGLFYTRNFHLNPRAVALEIAHWKLESLPLLSIIIICFSPMFLNWRVKNCPLTYYIQMENVFLWQNISVLRCVPNEKPLVCGSQVRQSQFVCCYAQQSVTCLKADKKVQIRTFFFQASYSS